MEADYKSLFESGLLTDVTIKCGDREWQLHKAVLCARSQWFKAALTGPFKESQTGVITLTEMSPAFMDLVITWIYTNDPPELDDQGNFYHDCVELFKVTDFFCLEKFQPQCLQILQSKIDCDVNRIQRKARQDTDKARPVRTSNVTLINDNLFAGLVEGFTTAPEPINRLWKYFTRTTYPWVMLDEEFLRKVSKVPDLSFRYLYLSSFFSEHETKLCRGMVMCVKCRKDPLEGYGGHFVPITSPNKAARCAVCASSWRQDQN